LFEAVWHRNLSVVLLATYGSHQVWLVDTHTQYQVHGVNFYASAIHNLHTGWCINQLLINVVGAGISEKAPKETMQAGEETKKECIFDSPESRMVGSIDGR
jgi:hypothetical protein